MRAASSSKNDCFLLLAAQNTHSRSATSFRACFAAMAPLNLAPMHDGDYSLPFQVPGSFQMNQNTVFLTKWTLPKYASAMAWQGMTKFLISPTEPYSMAKESTHSTIFLPQVSPLAAPLTLTLNGKAPSKPILGWTCAFVTASM